ncbi:MAG: hypothetical protein MJ252_08310 [archaeon]|nr:hypothetical protein [archaeon]
MKNKKQKKKGDEEAAEERIDHLKVDVEILEHDIHLEELREIQAYKDYDELLTKTGEIQKGIGVLKEKRDKEIQGKSKALAEDEEKKIGEINKMKDEIEQLKKEIVNLKKDIDDNIQKYQMEEDEKDEEIRAQENLFQQMTSKFQHILENTANKLQERVKMGN